jgi:hypothetical protein
MQALPSTMIAQPLGARVAPGWFKAVAVFMGACTPGGFLFLMALLTNGNVHFDTPVWFMFAAAGGVAAWFLTKRAFS